MSNRELTDALGDKVGRTDYATSEKAGLVSIGAGLALNATIPGRITTKGADDDAVRNERDAFAPLVPRNIPAFMSNYGITSKDIFSNPLNHNGIFRGKNLTDIYTIEEIYERVHSGEFTDLYLGDYFTVSITTTLPDDSSEEEGATKVVTENVDLMIAGFDYYWNVGDTPLTKHHIVLIPRNQGFATVTNMNKMNTTEGGYLNSYMHQTVLPCYAESLKVALHNHLLSHRTWLTNKVTTTAASMAGAGLTGSASGCEWATVELQLMNEVQLYGTTIWSSSAYDVGADNRQLPVFKFIDGVQFGRSSFWLRSIISSTWIASCYRFGESSYGNATSKIYVRPLMLFG